MANEKESLVDKTFGLVSSSIKIILLLFALMVVASIIVTCSLFNKSINEISGSTPVTSAAASSQPLSIEAKVTGSKLDNDGFNDYLTLGFIFKNNYTKTVTAIKGEVAIYDAFNEPLAKSDFVEYELSITPGNTAKKQLSVKLNPYSSVEQKTKDAAEGGQLRFVITPKTVAFSDGTTVQN